MSYVKVSNSTSTKEYLLTDTFNKPYMHISGSILPLTTNTTNGLQIKIEANNTTYRPLEYGSVSSSATYYTSAVNSEGLSSTTALTRSSTSGESYETRASTSATSFGTISGKNWMVSRHYTWNKYIRTYVTEFGQEFNFTRTSAYAYAYSTCTILQVFFSTYTNFTRVTTRYSGSDTSLNTTQSGSGTTSYYISQLNLLTVDKAPAMPTPYPNTYSGTYKNNTSTIADYLTYTTDVATTTIKRQISKYGTYHYTQSWYGKSSTMYNRTGSSTGQYIYDYSVYIPAGTSSTNQRYLYFNYPGATYTYTATRFYWTSSRSYGTGYSTGYISTNGSRTTTSSISSITSSTDGAISSFIKLSSSSITGKNYNYTGGSRTESIESTLYSSSIVSRNMLILTNIANKFGSSVAYTTATYKSTEVVSIISDTSMSVYSETYLTRSSTSKTVYLTRSSTSGYSGVSSSSSESSGWK